MKIKRIIPLILVVTLIISLGTAVFAAKSNTTKNETTSEPTDKAETTSEVEDEHNDSEEEIYKGDLYVFFSEDNENASSYVMDKNVDGNVFIFGRDVKITGGINGSLFVFASNLTIDESAYIAYHTFAAAENITMSGFTSDMYAAAGNFNMTEKGIVYRDLKLAAEKTTLLGNIGRNLDLAAENAKIYQDEEHNLFVGGNFAYSSLNEIEHINDITVDGEITYTQITKAEDDSNLALDYLYGTLESIVFTLVVYALIIFLAPKFVEKSKEYMSTRALLSAAIGLAFTILVPIIAILLLFVVIGMPLIFLLILVYIPILMISNVIVSAAIDEFIASKVEVLNATWKKILMVIPISAVIYLAKQIPIVGMWISAIVFLVGVGIVILYQFDKRRKEKVAEE